MAMQPLPTWGHKREAWDAAKAETQAVLVEIAKASKLIFYSELTRKIASINFQPDDHDFHRLLDQLSEESDAGGKGMISVLVVHMKDYRPGTGFFNLAKVLGRDISDLDKFWTEELSRVYRVFA